MNIKVSEIWNFFTLEQAKLTQLFLSSMQEKKGKKQKIDGGGASAAAGGAGHQHSDGTDEEAEEPDVAQPDLD